MGSTSSTVPRGLIGVVHLRAMPGDPRASAGGFDEVHAHALEDARRLVAGGASAIIVENFGSAPFAKGGAGARIPAHQAAGVARIVRACVEGFALPIGVNCLRNDAESALGIAAATGASFIRVNVHTGAYVSDQGILEGEADRTLRYRQALRAEHIAILADVLVKHAAPLAPLKPEDATHDTFDRGLADAVIVTGTSTGSPVDRDVLSKVRAAAGSRPVLLGSGTTPDNAPTLAPYVDAAIVGTWLKEDGRLDAAVDEARVRALVAVLSRTLREPT